MTNSRKFSESYLKMTAMKNRNAFYICSVLSNEAIKPLKLKRYLQQKHQAHVEKNLVFLKDKILVETAKIRCL